TAETNSVANALQGLSSARLTQARKRAAKPPQHLLHVPPRDHFHHLLSLFELREQAVDFLYRYPCAGGDPALARCFQKLGPRTFGRRHRIDDALQPANAPVVGLRRLRGAREL